MSITISIISSNMSKKWVGPCMLLLWREDLEFCEELFLESRWLRNVSSPAIAVIWVCPPTRTSVLSARESAVKLWPHRWMALWNYKYKHAYTQTQTCTHVRLGFQMLTSAFSTPAIIPFCWSLRMWKMIDPRVGLLTSPYPSTDVTVFTL